MNEEIEVLKIVTERLNKAGINYMISGSIAANYYTIPRMTRDIDIVIELKGIDINRFTDLFKDDFYIDAEMVRSEVLRQGMFNLIHNKYVVKIDFIIRKDSEFQEAAFSRRKKILIANNPLWIISAEDLILAKLLWAKDSHSELQLKDVRNIMDTVDDLDPKHIETWVAKLGLHEIFKELKR
ncbi:MAG: hypothetical protein KKI13_01860 [Candidatus Omnitrophica bacterium]|nr:hypothetical protein [Candidatus Omnitrophota bacterium]MCG2705565.1 hypothetical protein [Candidatus Omnitrophota bacterium]